MVPVTPYSPHLEERDPLVVMRETIPAFAAVLSGLSAEAWERPIAPGKWSVRKVMIHLAQTELALGTRARMALTREHYAAQSFDQDRWLALESGMSDADALGLFTALATANLSLYATLDEAARQTSLTHDEYGPMTVDWIIHQEAGHQVHHYKQLRPLNLDVRR